MEKIDTSSEDIALVRGEGDPISSSIKECIDKLNEIVEWINDHGDHS